MTKLRLTSIIQVEFAPLILIAKIVLFTATIIVYQ